MKQEFLYKSAAGVEYKLVVTEHGFVLYDEKTNELLVDASLLVNKISGDMGYWAVEANMSTTNREFYISHMPTLDNNRMEDKTMFGISKRM